MSQIQRLTDERWRSTPFTESYRTRSRLNEQSIAVSSTKPISVQSECPLSAKSRLVPMTQPNDRHEATLPFTYDAYRRLRGSFRPSAYPRLVAALVGNPCAELSGEDLGGRQTL